MTIARGWAAAGPGEPLKLMDYDLGPLKADEVEIAVEYCGVCHSDWSMWTNEWRITRYPFVGGHEAVGRIVAMGPEAKGLKVGQRVGVGWHARSDLASHQCLSGDHNLAPGNEGTIVGRHGGFADRLRVQWVWATPLPDGLSAEHAGPLFCGGITVFNPILECGVKPTDRVAVVGIGGLGHLAIRFLSKWGCEVTAFTSSPDKAAEAKALGAHRTLDSRDPKSWSSDNGRFALVLSTVAVALAKTLAPKGRLHLVGVAPNPVAMRAMDLIGGQLSLSGSPTGSPATVATMLEFCVRHGIAPQIETFPMSKINEAMAHLEAGKARYRIVLKADFA